MRLALLATVAGALACLGGGAEAAVVERSCHVDGFETPVRCVTVDVPRDYGQPDAGTLKITGPDRADLRWLSRLEAIRRYPRVVFAH